MKPGIYTDLSNEQYHAGPGLSTSQLKLFLNEPALVEWNRAAPADDEATGTLDIGTAVHCALLEPEAFDARFVVTPEGLNLRTNDGKAQMAAFQEEASMLGQIVLTHEEARKIDLMKRSVLAHPTARALLEAPGVVESSYYWEDHGTGILCRSRPDKVLTEEPVMVDVKTTADIDNFARSVVDFGYHIQQAHYVAGYSANNGGLLPKFIFLVVSTSRSAGKYPVRVFELSAKFVREGNRVWRSALLDYAKCQKSNDWPGVGLVHPPSWFKIDAIDDFEA